MHIYMYVYIYIGIYVRHLIVWPSTPNEDCDSMLKNRVAVLAQRADNPTESRRDLRCDVESRIRPKG